MFIKLKIMSTKNKIIFGIIVAVVLLFVIDMSVTLITQKPLLAIKDKKESINEVYYGLFTNSYNCAVYSSIQVKPKWVKYSCPLLEEGPRFEIIDPTRACAEALEEIYKDENYTYYLTCIKSKFITIEFEDGNVYTLDEVLKKNILSIDKLMENGLEVYISPNN